MYVLLANQRNKKYYIYFHYCKIHVFTLRSSGEYLWSINLFLSTRLLFIQHQTSCFDAIFFFFSCNTKFLFWILVRMLCHGDILLLSRSNKNINACQEKLSLFWCGHGRSMMRHRKCISFFVYHKFFIFNFYITHWQHVELLRSSF